MTNQMSSTNVIYANRVPTINLDHLVGRWDVWERMLKKIDPEADAEGCWRWTGWKSGDGYGRVKVDGVACTAHRVAYVIFNGPIPVGMVLDHDAVICGNRDCIQPLHMSIMTQKRNIELGKAVLFK